MGRRIAVSLLLIPLFGLLLQSFPVILLLTAAGHLWMQFEMTGLIHGLSRVGRIAHCAVSTLFMVWAAWQLHLGNGANLLLLLLLLVTVYAVLAVRAYEQGADPDMPWLLIRCLALLTLPLAFLPQVAAYGGSFPYLLLAVGASWGADVAAIFAGKACGRTPLSPALSPNKTVEGALAGVLAAGSVWAAAPALYAPDGAIAWHCAQHFPPSFLGPILFTVGGVTAMLGILGDLAFSLFKRQAHIKDYSAMLPGHGGLLDRADSLLLVIPLVYSLAYGM